MVKKENDQLVIRLPRLNLRSKVGALLAFRNKKIIAVFLITFVLVAAISSLRQKLFVQRPTGQASAETALKAAEINKSFSFSGIDNQGKEKGKIEFVVNTAEITDEVVVRDQTFKARNNKVFLLINLELTNNSTTPLNIIPGDLIRLIYNNVEDKKYAPDLHNNLVLVSPVSTRPDRVGFVIPNGAQEIKLQIGELEGKKEVIDIQFGS